LNSSDARERRAAINDATFAEVISGDVLIRLVQIFGSDPDQTLRDAAWNARTRQAGRARNGELAGANGEALRRTLLTSTERGDPARRASAISLLPDFVGAPASPMLEKLAVDGDPTILPYVVHAQVALTNGAERRTLLVDALKSSHPAVVDAAAAHLGSSEQADYVPALRELERDPTAGLSASLVLARWGQAIDRRADVLTPLLDSDRQWVKAAAARALTRSGDAELQDAIKALGHNDVNARVEVATALRERFDRVTESAARDRSAFAIQQEIHKSSDRPKTVLALKRHGLKVAGVESILLDMLASERSNAENKPTADAAVIALQDLYRLAAEIEATSKAGATTKP
jgi:hypothetical protein